MSDRLAELRRQRALIAEHLAWLDRQIAEASGAGGAKPPTSLPGPHSAPSPVPGPQGVAVVAAALKATAQTAGRPSESPEVVAAADAILEEYRQPEAALKTDIRKGCILYFVAALGVLAAGIAVLWFAFRK